MATPSLKSLERALELLGRVARFGDERSISQLAAEIGMPLSTAHRISATLERSRLITRLRREHYLPGPILLRLATPRSLNRVLVAVGRSARGPTAPASAKCCWPACRCRSWQATSRKVLSCV